RHAVAGLGLGRAGSAQPFAHPDVACDLAVPRRCIVEGRDPRKPEFVRQRMGHDERRIAIVCHQCIRAGDQRSRVVQYLSGHVAWIGDGAELRNMLRQHFARCGAGLRKCDAVILGLVGGHDCSPTGGREHSDARAARVRRLGKEGRGLDEGVEVVHHGGAGLLEGGAVHRVRPCQRARVRGCRRGALLARGHLVDDQGFSGRPRTLRGPHELQRCGHAFESAGDRSTGRVVDQVVNQVCNVHVARVAARQHVAERHAA
ncbi:conserved hypothetical protein, partial [Ricinus communis]